MQAMNNKLTQDEIEKLEQNYINSNSAPFIKKIQSMVSSIMEDIEYLDTRIENDFDELYNLTKNVTPAALPYAKLTTLIFDSKDKDIDHFIAFSIRMGELYRNKFEDLKKDDNLHKKDEIAISAIAKTVEHLSLAIAQKNNLYSEQTQRLNELDISGNEMTKELEEHKEELAGYDEKYKIMLTNLDKYENDLESYKVKYDKMTIDFLSMMGIFSTIIFAVFGGLSQIGAIGDNLAETPITKILMYLSLSAITLLSIVFISFNAISKLTGLNLRSCSCSVHEQCNHKLFEKHPTLSFSLFFFIDLFILSLILRASTSSDWVAPLSSLIEFDTSFEAAIRATVMVLFMILNLFFGWRLFKTVFPKAESKESLRMQIKQIFKKFNTSNAE